MTRLKKYGTESALQLLLDEAALDAPEGRVADYIPELRQADAEDSGISICYLDGTTLSAGSCEERFTIQSISKAPALLYALESVGPKQVFSRVGKEATGDPFNSGLRFQVGSKRPMNAMINAGAIVVSSMFPGDNSDQRFEGFLNFVGKVCGGPGSDMAVPKKKMSKAKSRSRRSSAWRVQASARSTCPRCSAVKRPHRVCGNCGFYGGRQAIDVD